MMNKRLAVLATVSALALTSTAFAGAPMALTDQQMDKVSAGGIADVLTILSASATGGSTATAANAAAAVAFQTPFVLVTPNGPVSLPIGNVQAIAASVSAN
jgi:hypothetical protein